MFKQNQKGFTLIEIVVVMGIISILAAIITINVQSARQKSRNGKRRVDIISLQAPLEAYYDANKVYPNTNGNWWGIDVTYGSHDVYGPNGWIPNLAPTYISRLPSDPLDNGAHRTYVYRSDTFNYKICALQWPPDLTGNDGGVFNNPKDTFYDPLRPDHCWMVCSGEPACSSW